QCSQNERRADEASRDVVSWLKCEFMQDKVGESFDGLVTAVTSFGLFVELTDIYVEGLVHITALPADYYDFDAVQHTLTGERAGRVFRLGDSIRVKVARVDLDERKIDFEMASDDGKADRVDNSRAVREKLLQEARKAGDKGSRSNKGTAREGRSGSRKTSSGPRKGGKGGDTPSAGPRKRKTSNR
ncbi:MAG: S1 RNA-binding domain-containing protein, partial [Pseudomonas formosensis]|nr:S1 RNA-binding domain-containing protein [Halopseudomonas formosensis]